MEFIDHVNIVVSNLEESTQFFCALGFNVCQKGDLEGEWISKLAGLNGVRACFVALELPEAQTKLELLQYLSPPSPVDSEISLANKIGFRHIAFRVKNIDEVVSKLEEQGIKLLSPVQFYPPARKKLVYFLGPDGILLELAQYS